MLFGAPVDLSFRQYAGWHTSPHNVLEQRREVQAQGTAPHTHPPTSSLIILHRKTPEAAVDHIIIGGGMALNPLSRVQPKFTVYPEHEVLLGLRWRARFYNAFRTSRRYSSSGIHVPGRRRGELS
jgi:hypothetical protein